MPLTYEMEQNLRNEARFMREAGIYDWDRNLRAAGLDPDRWSDGTSNLREGKARRAADAVEADIEAEIRTIQAERSVDEAELPRFDPLNPDAWSEVPATRNTRALPGQPNFRSAQQDWKVGEVRSYAERPGVTYERIAPGKTLLRFFGGLFTRKISS